jgi:sialate O-acetylesterase
MLQEIIDVPIGMIDNSWGGSSAEAWVRRELLEADARFAEDMEHWKELETGYNYERILAEYEEAHAEWKVQAEAAKAAGEAIPREPRRPRNEMTGNHRPGNIYNGCLKPILGYAIKGAIWYQGESNASRASRYNALFSLLISSWREEWGQGNFPFYWVQLADYKSYRPDPGESDWAELREAQTLTLSLPNTGQAVIYDNGEATDIHPRDKLTVARRLLRHALAKDYGIDVVADSPIYCSHKIEGDTMIIKIRNVGGGLDTFDVGEIYGFSIAGEDGVHVWAEAEVIDKNYIAVRSADVPNPASARYAWADNPIGNVRSKEGLLLTPFRTDAPAPTARMGQ